MEASQGRPFVSPSSPNNNTRLAVGEHVDDAVVGHGEGRGRGLGLVAVVRAGDRGGPLVGPAGLAGGLGGGDGHTRGGDGLHHFEGWVVVMEDLRMDEGGKVEERWCGGRW